jgi:hypothetical protein
MLAMRPLTWVLVILVPFWDRLVTRTPCRRLPLISMSSTWVCQERMTIESLAVGLFSGLPSTVSVRSANGRPVVVVLSR